MRTATALAALLLTVNSFAQDPPSPQTAIDPVAEYLTATTKTVTKAGGWNSLARVMKKPVADSASLFDKWQSEEKERFTALAVTLPDGPLKQSIKAFYSKAQQCIELSKAQEGDAYGPTTPKRAKQCQSELLEKRTLVETEAM